MRPLLHANVKHTRGKQPLRIRQNREWTPLTSRNMDTGLTSYVTLAVALQKMFGLISCFIDARRLSNNC